MRSFLTEAVVASVAALELSFLACVPNPGGLGDAVDRARAVFAGMSEAFLQVLEPLHPSTTARCR